MQADEQSNRFRLRPYTQFELLYGLFRIGLSLGILDHGQENLLRGFKIQWC